MNSVEELLVLSIVFFAAAYLVWHLFLRIEIKKPCAQGCKKEKSQDAFVRIGRTRKAVL